MVSEYLDDLILSGFIKRDHTWHISTKKKSALSHYRLSDNYLRFYLKYVEPNATRIKNKLFEDVSISSLPGWDSIMGLQVENLVINNRKKLHDLLSIPSSEILHSNPYFQKKTSSQQGCQIDYMIQTKFNAVYVCEIRYSKSPVQLQVINQVKQKIERLKLPKNYSYRPVLIYVGSVSEGLNKSSYFTHLINMSEFFAL